MALASVPSSPSSWRALLSSLPPGASRVSVSLSSVSYCPQSFFLWRLLLTDVCRVSVSVADPFVLFQRALGHLNKMPRLWIMFLEWLRTRKGVQEGRKWHDRALRALPVTQHHRIWKLYIEFARGCGVAETAVRVFRRYIKIQPESVEEYIDFLKEIGRYDEAAMQLAIIVNKEEFVSIRDKSRHDLWAELCKMISTHPEQIKLNVEEIIRSGIRRYPQEVGSLWCSLSDYFIRLALFERARDIFEEAIEAVNTVRDFSIVFDAYTQFEENMIAASIPAANEASDESEEALEDISTDIDMRLARLDHLIARRHFLLNSVVLRQNPHNANEWLNRIKLYKPNQEQMIIQSYADAVTTIDPQRATGSPHQVWIDFAKFYENHDDLENARAIFERAVTVNFKQVQHLTNVWCEWAEMEIRHENFDAALQVMQRATSLPRGKVFYGKEDDYHVPVQERLHKSTKLWSFYVDLEESLGTLESTRAVYDRILDLKVATPQIILNYAALLEENKFFEDSFRVYERGVALFHFPNSMPIWNTYLTKFIARYQGTKLERAREMFEMAIDRIPAAESKKIFMLYAKLEEDFGLVRRALLIYDRATRTCPADDKAELFNLYIRRATEAFGVTRTREIYQKALEIMPEKNLNDICLQFANMEKSLGEIDRARSIFVYASQFTDPSVCVFIFFIKK